MERSHNHTHVHSQIFSSSDGNGATGLAIAFSLTCLYMFVEAVGGFIFNSLALLADASHALSDAIALGLAWLAILIGKRAPCDKLTFGFIRSEILAALFNGLLLWGIVAVILFEAIQRLTNPVPVQGFGMFTVASIGLILNLIMARLLFPKRNASLNIKGAFLHVLSDAMGSVGAIIAGILIIYTSADWIDPLVSVVIGTLILFSSWGLLKEALNILMEGVPQGLDLLKIEEALVSVTGVCCVYDLHVWSISSSRVNLSAHIVLSNAELDSNEILMNINSILNKRFAINHSTIQIEKTHEMRSDSDYRFCRVGTNCGYKNAEASNAPKG